MRTTPAATWLGGIAFVLLSGGCAAMHRQTVENMRAKGDPRADCYEACGPSGVVCMKECDNKHPWAGTIFQGAAGGGGAAVPNNGATAGAGSGTADAPPAGSGDAPAQPPPGGVTPAQIEMLTAAALQDAARRKGVGTTSTSSGSMGSSSSSSSTSSYSSSSASGSRGSSSSSSSTSCSPACSGSQKCVVLLQGSKQCAPGGKCWTVDRTHGECR